jgi:hypothetical protein
MTINAWVAYIMGGAFLILLAALAVLLIINADLRASLAKSDAAQSVLQSQNKDWAEKMAARNAALAKIKAADAANAKRIKKAEAAATASEKKLTDEATALAALKFTGSDCDQATALAKIYLEHSSTRRN